jgi:copper resistance protein B
MKTARRGVYLFLAAALAALGAMAPAAHADRHQFPLPPKDWPAPVDDTMPFAFVLADRLEYRWNQGADSRVWDVQGWVGGDYDRFWFKTEGERIAGGDIEDAEVQALYARRIAPFWFVQAGVRYDARPKPTRNYAVLGIQGLAAYWFDVEATALVSDKGDTSARLEAEYDVLFTQRLILQPRIETNGAFSADEARGVGKGVNDVELGLRLRYEIKREFAPYIGITWRKNFGDTADLARRTGVDVENRAIVAGVRVWY